VKVSEVQNSGFQAVKGLLEKTGTSPGEIDLLICATVTPDMSFPGNCKYHF
jgi:3-oxoacyl-[acyl-carrier-protein] synthase III